MKRVIVGVLLVALSTTFPLNLLISGDGDKEHE